MTSGDGSVPAPENGTVERPRPGLPAPVPRAVLTPRARAGLWALRVFVVVVGAMVVYTFVSQL